MNKKSFFKNKPIVITVIAVVLLALLALFTSGERTVTWVEGAIGTIVTPVQSFASASSNAIIRFFQNMFNTTDADKENAILQRRVVELENDIRELEELRNQNERLRELLNYAETLDNTQYVTAAVIGKSDNVWFNTITINAGRNQGIQKGDPVINQDGLVGIVNEAAATWCKVVCIIDGESSVSVLNERTRREAFVRGVIKNGTEGNLLEMYFMPAGSDLLPNDKILTSGLGSTAIPKGILVGTVSEVSHAASGGINDVNAYITPAVDFLSLEEVMVIINGRAD